jgi:hypothetical protein
MGVGVVGQPEIRVEDLLKMFKTKVSDAESDAYFDSRPLDSLAGKKIGLMKEANVDAARTYYGVSGYGPGWWGPGWYWDPWFAGFTYLPGAGFFY